ncbi:hypothetical protein BT69DRAFT_1279551 [Atractiella rhizophila]|nr:hypothetical protein BT69DRAFT_1279551 [Atractiella rhizophila]
MSPPFSTPFAPRYPSSIHPHPLILPFPQLAYPSDTCSCFPRNSPPPPQFRNLLLKSLENEGAFPRMVPARRLGDVGEMDDGMKGRLFDVSLAKLTKWQKRG